MRYKLAALAVLLVTTIAFAKELKAYQDGKLLQMDSVQCGMDEKDANRGKTRVRLCLEYTVQSDQVVYRVRPKDNKHSALLPIGQNALFRLEKNRMMLRVEGFDSKEREYVVVSVKSRGDNTANASPTRLNHLQ